MKHKTYPALMAAMMADPRDFSLEEIYKAVCRAPHQKGLDVAELHSRISRAVGELRHALRKEGYVLVLGDLRHSYKVVKRGRR